MPNQLFVPFKKTGEISIRQHTRDYINEHRIDTNANAFKWDIDRWEKLRADATDTSTVHVNRIDVMIKYHAQLVFILTKLPHNLGIDIHYAPAFIPNVPHIHLANLFYERAAVLFNLAALCSQLGNTEDRSTTEGIKRSVNHYQTSAGVFGYLRTSVLPKLKSTLTSGEHMPVDLTEESIKSLELLMLAQAQEGAWQRAMLDNMKNNVVAKLAWKVGELYAGALATIQRSPASIKNNFTSRWLAHIEVKSLHFAAAAQFRKSIDDLEAGRYGNQVARLGEARAAAQKGLDLGRRNGVVSPVLDDIKNLFDKADKEYRSAERDNDMIYHQDIPSSSSLEPIAGIALAVGVIPKGIEDPKVILSKNAEDVIFGDLPSWGAQGAIDIYEDRKANCIKDEIISRVQELDGQANQTLHSLNLPASLEALEKPIGMPPSLLKKAEEVRTERGPEQIDRMLEDIQRLSQSNRAKLMEAMDILDQEAEEDESLREQYPNINRPVSTDANRELVTKYQRLQSTLDQSLPSDERIRQKWADWAQVIEQLTWEEEELEAAIPSSTISSGSTSRDTKTHARALRRNVERIDDLQRARGELVRRAQALADADDIRSVIMRQAAGFERWAEVTPVMFEDTLATGIEKYAKFVQDIEESGEEQDQILEEIKVTNAAFLQSRKEDPVVKDREHALQSLDFAYHKYKEIHGNLTQGVKWHNDMGTMISTFKTDCKAFEQQRQAEIHDLLRAASRAPVAEVASPDGVQTHFDLPDHSEQMAEVEPAPELESEPVPPSPPVSPVVPVAVAPTSTRKEQKRRTLNVPPPDSGEWQTLAMPSTPTAKPVVKKKTKKAALA